MTQLILSPLISFQLCFAVLTNSVKLPRLDFLRHHVLLEIEESALKTGAFLRPEPASTVASTVNNNIEFRYANSCYAIAKSARNGSRIGVALYTLPQRWRRIPLPAAMQPGKSGTSAKCHATSGGLISFLDAPRTVGSTPCASLLHRDTRSSS